MVVLLRAFTHLDAYEDSLERAALRPYVVGGRGYWSQQQVTDVCALLAAIANPLDDEALFGALASPACGITPDTLWLLRAAAGKGRHVWPAVERAGGASDVELDDPARLEQIPAPEWARLRTFAERIASLRRRGPRLPLAGLIDAAVTETGYDLAVLMRHAGEARFANVRKLMRLAAEFEAREGRDLRGLLDFLSSRAETGSEAQAASAVEGHDGVRIMTVHSAKGLEFDVVAVPHLSRRLLAGSRLPSLTLGHDGDRPRVGMQLRRLGAGSISLYAHNELCEEMQRRDAEEELRLFHVAATRARERLILSGVTMPQPGREAPGSPVIERIVGGFGIDREANSSIPIPPPQPQEGLDATFPSSEIAVRVNLPSPERAAELATTRRADTAEATLGEGPAPLLERRPPTVPNRPLSYTAIAAYEACPYRFYMERVLGLGRKGKGDGEEGPSTASAREERAARGSAVHSLLEWSQANGWREPSSELVGRHALAAGFDSADESLLESLLTQVRSWLDSELLRDRIGSDPAGVRAEVPILLGIAGTVLRGSIDLLAERDGARPMVVDYKTDRLDGSDPAERAAGYAIQRSLYALAVAEAQGIPEVEVAYVFLERPDAPQISVFGPAEIEAGRERISALVTQIGAGEFPVAAEEERSWALCKGCPALNRLCSGPAPASTPARPASAP
jgi:ATP-dependent exoDNAse (exonuclease V) beta subunit